MVTDLALMTNLPHYVDVRSICDIICIGCLGVRKTTDFELCDHRMLLPWQWPCSHNLFPTVATAQLTEPQVTEPKAPTKYIPPAKRYGSDAKREGESMTTRTRGGPHLAHTVHTEM